MVPYWSLKIYGREKIDNRKHYIMVSNHQSLADIVLIYSLFKHFRWTSKVENFKFPFVGWVLSLNRSIKVYRGASDAYLKFEEQALRALNNGNSIMIFPEGTRSKDGKMGNFKDGAFRLAHDTKTDILPMVLDGTSKAIPKSGWILRGRQKMILKVLDPEPYNDFSGLSLTETSGLIRGKIHKSLVEIRSNVK
jgi:1-acyl-sn-glycerol-3-phosphate acyltransferase